jgi:hypothetical protein
MPTARSEVTSSPLLKVPPASRGEPREARLLGSPLASILEQPRRRYTQRAMKRITHLATQIENALQQILEHDADALARETGFVQRQRKLTGSTFAQRMVFGAASNPCPTYTDWTHAATCAGTTLTPQAIEQRFTPKPPTSCTPCSNALQSASLPSARLRLPLCSNASRGSSSRTAR